MEEKEREEKEKEGKREREERERRERREREREREEKNLIWYTEAKVSFNFIESFRIQELWTVDGLDWISGFGLLSTSSDNDEISPSNEDTCSDNKDSSLSDDTSSFSNKGISSITL